MISVLKYTSQYNFDDIKSFNVMAVNVIDKTSLSMLTAQLIFGILEDKLNS